MTERSTMYSEYSTICTYYIWHQATPSQLVFGRDAICTAQKRALESALVEGVTEDQPCNLSGAYKLVSLENFDTFLEVQSKKRICVASLLQSYEFVILTSYLNTHPSNIFGIRKEFLGLFERQPSLQSEARPSHHSQRQPNHNQNRRNHRETETTYIINGPPVEIDIRGRIFCDQYTYLESGKGIKGIKKAITENYDVYVQRFLSEDMQKLTLVSTRVIFRDGDDREPVECTQIFERIQ